MYANVGSSLQLNNVRLNIKLVQIFIACFYSTFLLLYFNILLFSIQISLCLYFYFYEYFYKYKRIILYYIQSILFYFLLFWQNTDKTYLFERVYLVSRLQPIIGDIILISQGKPHGRKNWIERWGILPNACTTSPYFLNFCHSAKATWLGVP